jgi:hypothetical protein
MTLMLDCKTCGTKFDWDTKDESQLCSRCKTLGGTDMSAIIKELRKAKVPGLEPVWRVLALMEMKIATLEKGLILLHQDKEGSNVVATDIKPN